MINSWLQCKVLGTRSYRDPIDRWHCPRLFAIPSKGVQKFPQYPSARLRTSRPPPYFLPSHAIPARIPHISTLDLPWPPRLLEIRQFIALRGNNVSGAESTPLGAQTKALLTECKKGSESPRCSVSIRSSRHRLRRSRTCSPASAPTRACPKAPPARPCRGRSSRAPASGLRQHRVFPSHCEATADEIAQLENGRGKWAADR